MSRLVQLLVYVLVPRCKGRVGEVEAQSSADDPVPLLQPVLPLLPNAALQPKATPFRKETNVTNKGETEQLNARKTQ